MPSYLLLRNNKESGPFLKEQLIQFGLKPYDLIWIEGKSAAWRYPSEISEFKEYAPAIEEQPYDRFYKKNTDEQKVNETILSEIKSSHENHGPVKQESYLTKKNVSVIMPGSGTVAVKKTRSLTTQAKVQPTLESNSPEIETKYSQPLDEIKEMYVRQLQKRKYKIAKKKLMIKRSRQVAIILGIIAASFFAGVLIKSKSSPQKRNSHLTTQNSSSINKQAVQSIANTDSLHTSEIIGQSLVDDKMVNEEMVNNGPLIASVKDKAEERSFITEKKDESLSKFDIQPRATSGNPDQNRANQSPDLENEKKPAVRLSESETEEITKLISLKSNDYKLKAFGGFQNLELTVQNDSKYALDNVLVELLYLKINDKPAKIEHIKFQSIAPGGSLSIRVPDNNRGAKIVYKIVRIEPKDISLSTAGL